MVELFQRGSVKKYQKERGHFRHYLKRIIHNKCCDFITLNAKEKGMEAELQARCLQASQDPEQDEKEWKEFLMIKALEILRQEVSEQQYMLFDLYARQNRPVRVVCQILGVSENQVSLAKCHLTERLAKIVQQLQGEAD